MTQPQDRGSEFEQPQGAGMGGAMVEEVGAMVGVVAAGRAGLSPSATEECSPTGKGAPAAETRGRHSPESPAGCSAPRQCMCRASASSCHT